MLRVEFGPDRHQPPHGPRRYVHRVVNYRGRPVAEYREHADAWRHVARINALLMARARA